MATWKLIVSLGFTGAVLALGTTAYNVTMGMLANLNF